MAFLDADRRWTYQTLSEAVRRRSRWMEGMGALLIVLGVLALSFAVISSLLSAIMIGWLLLFAGVTQIAAAFAYWQQRRGGYTVGLLLGVLCVIAGILCLINPARSLQAITFTLAVYFVGSGIIRLPITVTERFPGWSWGVVAAIADILLGILILALLPGASLVVLGTLVGIQLIVSGTTAFMSGVAVRRLLEPRPEAPPAEPPRGRPATRFQH
ncbi:MAG TPA: HdeD family acid-resistance protein [Planctomycetota bacterium]|jgi:uncharacterized membrane protein HdeD (DUF308 family)|nr:HdeD family acid-resistance protein [Planctomycetota bacterium]